MVYRTYFYAMNSNTMRLLPGYAYEVQSAIMRSYSLCIKHFVNEQDSCGSMMRIKKLRKVPV